MSDNKVTLDQLDSSAVEAMSSSVGDVSMLNTENKTIVGALAEIVGKKEIANAIGEPLAETDKFTEMSSEINGLLSAFKTNMMNAGVVVESGDKFKALIDKIKGLTEGEGNKGIQFTSGSTNKATGTKSFRLLSNNGESITTSYYNIQLEFTPIILLTSQKFTYWEQNYDSIGVYESFYRDAYTKSNAIINNEFYTTNNLGGVIYEINVGDSYIEIPMEINDSNKNVDELYYYAIGVGEEDTTLRDSLASILQEEGVEVTEDDDMASLITKVDEEFDDKYSLDSSKEGFNVVIHSAIKGNGTDTWAVSSTSWITATTHTMSVQGVFKVGAIMRCYITSIPAKWRVLVNRDNVDISNTEYEFTNTAYQEHYQELLLEIGDIITIQTCSTSSNFSMFLQEAFINTNLVK